MDRKKDAEWKKPDKRTHTVWLRLRQILESANESTVDRKQMSDCLRTGEKLGTWGGRGAGLNSCRRKCWVMGCLPSRPGDGSKDINIPRNLLRCTFWRWTVYCTLFTPQKSFFFFLFRATPAAYGSSQAKGWIRAAPAGLRHSHSNVGSEPHLRPTPQLMVTPDP